MICTVYEMRCTELPGWGWVMNSHYGCGNVILWYRYTDDVLCFWRGSDSELGWFHQMIVLYKRTDPLVHRLGYAMAV